MHFLWKIIINHKTSLNIGQLLLQPFKKDYTYLLFLVYSWLFLWIYIVKSWIIRQSFKIIRPWARALPLLWYLLKHEEEIIKDAYFHIYIKKQQPEYADFSSPNQKVSIKSFDKHYPWTKKKQISLNQVSSFKSFDKYCPLQKSKWYWKVKGTYQLMNNLFVIYSKELFFCSHGAKCTWSSQNLWFCDQIKQVPLYITNIHLTTEWKSYYWQFVDILAKQNYVLIELFKLMGTSINVGFKYHGRIIHHFPNISEYYKFNIYFWIQC